MSIHVRINSCLSFSVVFITVDAKPHMKILVDANFNDGKKIISKRKAAIFSFCVLAHILLFNQ